MHEHDHERQPTPEAWDKHCFENAAYFTVCSFDRREKSTHETFAQARAQAAASTRVLIYAVTIEGHSALMTPSRWDEYTALASGH